MQQEAHAVCGDDRLLDLAGLEVAGKVGIGHVGPAVLGPQQRGGKQGERNDCEGNNDKLSAVQAHGPAGANGRAFGHGDSSFGDAAPIG